MQLGDAAGVAGVDGNGLRVGRQRFGGLGQFELEAVDLVLEPVLIDRSVLDPGPFPLLDQLCQFELEADGVICQAGIFHVVVPTHRGRFPTHGPALAR